jgi:hypothetical protein
VRPKHKIPLNVGREKFWISWCIAESTAKVYFTGPFIVDGAGKLQFVANLSITGVLGKGVRWGK